MIFNFNMSFTDDEWKLVLYVNTSNTAGTLLLSLEWQRPDSDDVYPFEEVRYFSRHLKWGRYKNIIFPTNVAIQNIPQNIIKSSFTDLKDSEGGKFIYDPQTYSTSQGTSSQITGKKA